jgi:hypothetical protein
MQLSFHGTGIAVRLGADCLALLWFIFSGISGCRSVPAAPCLARWCAQPGTPSGSGVGASTVRSILMAGRTVASFRIDGYLNVTYGLATKDTALS